MENLSITIIDPESALAAVRVLSWLALAGSGKIEQSGPATAAGIAEFTNLSEAAVVDALARLRAAGFIDAAQEQKKILEFPRGD